MKSGSFRNDIQVNWLKMLKGNKQQCLFFIFLLFFAFTLHARDVTITVEDTELALPLEGAVIRSWDGSQYTCNEDGIATIAVPDDRQVIVQVAYPGYESGRLAITADKNKYSIGLRLSGIMESKELVIEAARPGASETKTGRSIAITGRDIAQTAEIGIIEDVMSSIKLLPGVGYAGFFNAQPSIRGGHPGDMSAALDGFYVMNPYHWGGGVSIFDPRMVQSAQLSHGVFSVRYGNTISGLLDITSKKPSSTETEFELGAGTSAANFSLSVPLVRKGSNMSRGGILFMGRITYYDPVIALAKQLAKVIENEQFQQVNSIRVAPYIRSGAINGNYRFSDKLELTATGFWGMDGVGVTFINEASTAGELTSSSGTVFDFTNYQGFITAALNWNPRNNMLLKFSAGTGYEDVKIDGEMESSVNKNSFSQEFYDKYKLPENINPMPYQVKERINQSEKTINAQGRVDYDWELGSGFLVAAGIHEMLTRRSVQGEQQGFFTVAFNRLPKANQDTIKGIVSRLPEITVSEQFWNDLRVAFSVPDSPDTGNSLFTTSGYGMTEYHTPDRRFGAELGLRIDHYFMQGKGFSIQTKPALSPRLNMDFNVLKDRWILESLDISAGTGFFTTMDDVIFMAEERYNITDVKPNRAWTSVLGTRLEFSNGLHCNIEGYYKYVYDRMYIPVDLGIDSEPNVRPQFNGEGRVWGFDIMLQKLQSRFWDGWLSYSYSWARYRDPSSAGANMGISGGTRGDDWYFPGFHRFHNLNLVLNIKPAPQFNIYTRFGFASGTQLARRVGDRPKSYPVLTYNPDDPSGFPPIIERYSWPSVSDENNRVSPTLPLDIKFSYFGKNKNGRSRYELYVAVENALSLVYRPQGNTRFNSYTGEIDTGSDSASYGIPIPIPSFGVKISY